MNKDEEDILKYKRTAEIVKYLFAGYPKTRFTAENAVVYTTKFANIDPDLLMATFQKAVDKYKTIPSIAELKEDLVRSKITDLSSLDAQFKLLSNQLRNSRMPNGAIKTRPLVGNEVTNRVLDELDWRSMCSKSMEQVEKEFRYAYLRIEKQYIEERSSNIVLLALPAKELKLIEAEIVDLIPLEAKESEPGVIADGEKE